MAAAPRRYTAPVSTCRPSRRSTRTPPTGRRSRATCPRRRGNSLGTTRDGSAAGRSGLRALECDEDGPGPALGLEGGGAVLAETRGVVADRQGVAFDRVDPLPDLPFQRPFRMLEVDGGGFDARVDSDGSRVEARSVLGLDLESVGGQGQPIADHVVGGLAVTLRSCRRPGALECLV